MFVVSNTELEALIRNSVVLKSKLNDVQLQRFIESAMTLPEEGQEELLAALKEESKEVDERKNTRSERLIKILHEYNDEVKKELKTFERVTYKKAEDQFEKDEEKDEEELLKELDNIA